MSGPTRPKTSDLVLVPIRSTKNIAMYKPSKHPRFYKLQKTCISIL